MLLALALGLSFASRMSLGSAPNGENMRIRVEEISISVPAEFQPLLGATFTNDETRETVSIGQGTIPAGATGSAYILDQRVEEFESKLGVTAAKEQARPVTLLGRAGHLMVLSFNYQGSFMRVWWVVVCIDDMRFLQITYMTPDTKGAAAKFDRMVSSATTPDRSSDAKSSPDWINRYAGLIALDVPTNLAPPHVYSFVAPREHNDLAVKLYARGSNAGTAPTLPEEIANDTQSGGIITENVSRTFAVSGGAGTLVSYVLTKKELTGDEKSAVHRARVVFKDGLVVLLEGRGLVVNRARLDAVFQEITTSLEQLKP